MALYHASLKPPGLVLPSGSSSSESAFGQQQTEWKNSPSMELPKRLTGYGANAKLTLVEACSLSETAAVLSG